MLIRTSGTPQNIDELMRGLPVPLNAHSADLIQLTAERFMRAQAAMTDWANAAKKAVQYVEGEQWTAEQLRKMADEQRPALTFNKIAPLVRLVLGYQRNNRLDTKFLPAHDGSGSEAVAEAITKICKQIATEGDEEYVDAEWFLDGLITGRGFIDYRLDFEHNDLGEILGTAGDPFAKYLDPEASAYDLNTGTYIQDARWVSLDEVEVTYGKPAAQMLWNFVGNAGSYGGGIPYSLAAMQEEVTPWRTFAGADSWSSQMGIHAYLANCYDPARKNVRLVDTQHYIRTMQRCVVDLETGRREAIPDSWDDQRIAKMMDWLGQQYASKGMASPYRVTNRMVRRVRWTTMVGDLLVYDAWSPYETFTTIPFFPYFRRGKTRGMVDDLIDPQDEINKRRSAQIDITTRTAHSGWMYHTNGLNKEGKDKIERYGAMPGVNIEWQGEPAQKPERIQPATPPMAFERLEEKSAADLKEISGINDSSLGQLDRVQSGRAIEARQRQAVLSIQVYMDNAQRTKKMIGRKKLEMIQNHYTEARTFRILTDDGTPSMVSLNLRQANGQIMNDVAVGNYSVTVDATPLSASFLSAQFDELLSMVEKGILPAAMIGDVAIDISSLPQKDVLKARISAGLASMGLPTGEQVNAAQGLPASPVAGVPGAPQPQQVAMTGPGMESGVPLPMPGNPMVTGPSISGGTQ